MLKWYKLDNAAKVFPAVTTVKNTSVFRVSAVLTEKADPILLQKAVDKIYNRFPMLTVKLRRGVFWNYFDPNSQKLIVQKEEQYPCSHIQTQRNNGYLIRVLYFQNRISVEVFHSLTDGTGAVEYLKSLLYYYLIFAGKAIDPQGKIILADTRLAPDDTKDGFIQYASDVRYKKQTNARAYKIKGTSFYHFGNNVIHGTLDAKKLNQISKKYSTTITGFLVSLLIYSIYHSRAKYERSKKPIVVAVPVNLRKHFPSRTLRNFFCVIYIRILPSHNMSFDDIVVNVDKQLKEKTTKDYLEIINSQNVLLEKTLVNRFVPLLLKHIFVNIGFRIRGENKRTISLSNLGRVSIPDDMSNYIERIETVMYPSKKSPINSSICTINNTLAVTFTRAIQETDVIQNFFTMLVEKTGLDVMVGSNDWGEEDEQMH